MDFKGSEQFHQSPDVTVCDKHRFLRECVKVDAQAGQCGEHAIKDGLVRRSEGVKHPLVAVFTGMDHAANFLFNGLFIGSLLTNHLSSLVPAHSLVVSLAFPFRVESFSALEGRFNIFLAEVCECPCEHTNLLPHVIDVVFCTHFVSEESVQSHERVSKDGVSCTAYMEGSIWVCRGVLDEDFASGRLARSEWMSVSFW